MITCSICLKQVPVEELVPHDGTFESDVCKMCASRQKTAERARDAYAAKYTKP